MAERIPPAATAPAGDGIPRDAQGNAIPLEGEEPAKG